MEVRSLKDWSCSTVVAHIRNYSICELLRLPLAQRYQVLDRLPALQVWSLEYEGFTEGLDTEKVWKARCRGATDFTHSPDLNPPKLKIVFINSITSEDAYFLCLWNRLDRLVTVKDQSSMVSLMRILFSDNHACDREHYLNRIPDVLRNKSVDFKDVRHRPSPVGVDKTKMACDCARDVLNLVLESGYRPSYITFNSVLSSDAFGRGSRPRPFGSSAM